MRKAVKLANIGTELEVVELELVHGGQQRPDPRLDPLRNVDWNKVAHEVYEVGKVVVEGAVVVGKEIYHAGQSVWHSITSWF
jgi:hypothetical protein